MKLFENKTYKIVPLNEFKLFRNAPDFPAPTDELGKAILANAQTALETEIPQLYASQYRRFALDGNRSEYEDAYFDRRRMLKRLLLGELVEKSGRYTDKIIDVVWLILEESSWIIPAHNKYEYYEDPNQIDTYPQLPRGFDGKVTFVDLFSAETGALLALVYHYLKDSLIASNTEIVSERILYAVKERAITPFIRYEHMFWMGGNGHIPNNWNPWILSNILLITALTENETEQRQHIVNKALRLLDNFLDFYNEDGGCNEGPHYWGEAAAALCDTLEILDDLTGGKADVFTHPLIYNMMDYIRKVHLTGNCFANFADSDPTLYHGGFPNVIRMGQYTNNTALASFAAMLTPKLLPFYCDYGHNYRTLRNVCTHLPAQEKYVAADFDVLPDLQLAVWRKGAFRVAIKGGHNDESHNHNDVGNMIVFCNEKPILIDIGAPTYTKDVFSSKRYEVFPIASQWHNLPIVDGKTQSVGEAFSTNTFHANESSACVEYSKAYNAENVSCLRELTVNNDTVTVHETVSAQNSVVFHYYTCVKPQKASDNKYIVNDATVTFSSDYDCQVEPIPMTDEKCIENWQTDTLYRFVVQCSANADFEIKIEA